MNRTTCFSLCGKVFAGLCFLTLPLAPLGCSSEPAHATPVKGQVFVDGQPAVGAEVVFYPVQPDLEKPFYPSAIVGEDGSFELTTFSAHDGAPPGDYKVSVVWRDSWRVDGDTIYGPDKLKGHYSNASGAPLPATVKPETNMLPRFDLKK